MWVAWHMSGSLELAGRRRWGCLWGEKHIGQLWFSHCCVLCDHLMSLHEGQLLPGSEGIL